MSSSSPTRAAPTPTTAAPPSKVRPTPLSHRSGRRGPPMRELALQGLPGHSRPQGVETVAARAALVRLPRESDAGEGQEAKAPFLVDAARCGSTPGSKQC